MECINIRVNNGRVDVTVDGAKLTDVHSVSVDYIKGVPLLFSCVADIGREQEERRGRTCCIKRVGIKCLINTYEARQRRCFRALPGISARFYPENKDAL